MPQQQIDRLGCLLFVEWNKADPEFVRRYKGHGKERWSREEEIYTEMYKVLPPLERLKYRKEAEALLRFVEENKQIREILKGGEDD